MPIALKLSILLAYPELYEWYLQRFNNIFTIRHEKYDPYTHFSYNEHWYAFCNDVFSSHVLNYSMLSFIPDFDKMLIEMLQKDAYVYIWVDFYYIPENKKTNAEHFAHPVLVYGFDETKEIFYVLLFEMESDDLNEIEVPYDILLHAFREAKQLIEIMSPYREFLRPVEFIFINIPLTSYRFDVVKYVNDLNQYINGQADIEDLFFRSHYYRTHSLILSCGINIYDEFIDLLQQRNVVDYRILHMLWEYLEGCKERLNFIENRYNLNHAIDKEKALLSEAIKHLDISRSLWFKGVTQCNQVNIFSIPNNEKIINRIIQHVNMAKELQFRFIPDLIAKIRHTWGTENHSEIKNLTKCADISTSSFWSDNECPQNLIDGNSNTFWRAKQGYSNGEYIVIDFNNEVHFNCIVLKQNRCYHRITSYKLETSNDKSIWQEVHIYDGKILMDLPQTIKIAETSARYLKLTILKTQRDDYGENHGFETPALGEIEVYNTPE